MLLCNTMFAEVVPGDSILRSGKMRHNGQPLSANVWILPVDERLNRCCDGGDVALNTTEGVGGAGRKTLKRIHTGVGVESSRLETKFARTRAVTLISRKYMRELQLEIQSFLPQNRDPGWFPHRA